MQKDGATVDWANTLDPVMTTIHGMGLASKANRPNAAKLFIDFALSRNSRQIIRDMRLVPSRRDVEPAVPKIDRHKLKIRRIPMEAPLYVDQYGKEFRQIFGL